jgi:putative ABC transport system substrate-binding protein
VLVNPNHALTERFKREVQAAAKSLNMTFDVREASNVNDLDRALAALAAHDAQGLFVAPDPFLTGASAQIAAFATARRWPAVHYSKRFAEAGGLMSYGGSLDESYRAAARHVDRILKGAKPGDLPVEQPTRFDLVVNLKTAKAIGVKIPDSLVLQASQTIE